MIQLRNSGVITSKYSKRISLSQTQFKMTDGMLSLWWNNHSTTFCHMLSALRHKDRYTDATVACEGKFYPVHKLVLSTCSQYFEDMFDHTLGKHPIVLLQDVKCDELEALLSYMYVGVVSVAQKDLPRLIKVAELLQIKGLAVPDEAPGDKNTPSSSSGRSARRSPLSRGSVDSLDDRGSPHPKRRKQNDIGSPSPREPFENHNAHSPRLSLHSKDSDESLDYNTSGDRSRREVYPEQARGSESQTEALHHRRLATCNSVPEESNMLSGVNLNKHPASGNTSKETSEDAIVIKEEVWEDPELSHNNSADPGVTYNSALDNSGPDSHDEVQKEDMGMPKEFNPPGDPAQGSQELPEVVEEALAGPSGMQEWLGSNDFAAGLASVENFSIDGSPPVSEHPQPLQIAREESQKCDKGATGAKTGIISSSKFHQCPYCAYDTPRKDHLVMHIRTHTGEKPFSCPYCPSRFVQKGTLSNHIRTHTGEKPFSCPLCPQCFARNSHLRSHMSTHHKGRVSTAT
ncbi:zinc finger and BTB domain-containing protein 7A-like isoform X3 [Penaeus japonicus]|uniref:zinc finger and BTB domain-containing protein 7A-like isoform X3 n=1 Tax=Penaeus japonicus TaxID=27405 RepID=UPI001C714D34|nr:zinc finger and BTB domain-containing protein 7A-like isoform X3 [Penaeus japonicus]